MTGACVLSMRFRFGWSILSMRSHIFIKLSPLDQPFQEILERCTLFCGIPNTCMVIAETRSVHLLCRSTHGSGQHKEISSTYFLQYFCKAFIERSKIGFFPLLPRWKSSIFSEAISSPHPEIIHVIYLHRLISRTRSFISEAIVVCSNSFIRSNVCRGNVISFLQINSSLLQSSCQQSLHS